MPEQPPLVLAVVPEHIGGRRLGGSLAAAFESSARIVVVERAEEVPATLAEATVIITALSPISAEHIAAAPRLRVVQCASHGSDHVDLGAAFSRGIRVATIRTTGAEKDDVAEHVFALMLTLAKQILAGHLALRNGDWALPQLQRSITELFGKTLGIVGMGEVGLEVARRAAAFGMTVIYNDRHPPDAEGSSFEGARWEPLDDLLRASDYVTLHLPLTPETRTLIDARRLSLMKSSAFLINTSRGALVDQQSLAVALERGIIAGAGIDVFDPEPPSRSMRLLHAPNVVLSPHVAGVTRETVVRIAQAAFANVLRYLTTGDLADEVTDS
ncbi:MAG: phosphoglycerate dehydrogenase [Candidatus Dormibacteraeota bacterium]|nr:phosphoglycerate dehydrogenase [Candidatus Dormibacteraeota bacterium]